MDPESEVRERLSKGRSELTPHDRRALVAVAVQFFANGAMTASFVAQAPQIRDRIAVDIGAFGLLLTLSATAGIPASLLAGRIVHSVSTRRVLGLGAVVMVGGLSVIALAKTSVTWLVGMGLYVFFDTLVDISMNLQGSWLSARRHTPVINRLHGLWSVGTLAGGLGAVVANASGTSPRVHLLIVAAVMAAALAVVTRSLLPSDEQGHGASPSGETAAATPGTGRASVVLLVFAGMFAVVMEVTASDWATFRLSDDLDASAALASAAFVAYSVGMTAMRFAGDFLELRLGRQRLHGLSLALSVFGFALASLVPSRIVSLAGFLLVGLGVATFMPKLYADAARVPGRRGAGLGAMTAGMRAAYLLTPALVGGLVDRGLSVGAAIAICSFSAAVGLAMHSGFPFRNAARQ